MSSYRRVTVVVVIVVFLCSAVGGDQNEVLSNLLNRMTALEGKVASLDSRLSEIDGGEKPAKPAKLVASEFRVVNASQSRDHQASTVTYTVTYQALHPVQILMAPREGAPPMELSSQNGTVHFSVPDTAISPMLYIRSSSNLIYTLILIQAGGPIPEEPETFPSVVLATAPERFIKFQENQEPELTITSHVTGNRQIRKETLIYHTFVLNDFIVDFFGPFHVYKDNLGPSFAESNDVVNAVNDDEQNLPQRLTLLDHNREGRETIDRLKLDTNLENSGVLFVEKRFELLCQGCTLYEIRVSKPMPYFLDDDEYLLGKGALVAYKDLYNFGPDFEGPRYFRFIRYDESETAHAFQKTCQAGQPCELICEAFGDNPTTYFYLFGRPLLPQPVYFDQSGSHLSENDLQRAKVKGWSVKFGYMGFSVINFDDVRAEHAGNYDCFAEIDSGLMLRRVYTLTVN